MADRVVELKEKALMKEIGNLEMELAKEYPDPKAVGVQIKIICSKYKAYETAHQKLLEQILENENEEEYLEAEDKLSEVQRKQGEAERAANEFLYSYNEPPPETSKVHLPELKLQQFTGDVRDWLRFWNSFEEIHQNMNISDRDKFGYLLQCIPANSQARKCINGFPVHAKNYDNAIQALRNTFGKESTLVKVYVREIQQIVVKNSNEKTRIDFMELVPTLVCQIRNLEQLGVTTDKCESILYPVVESCLPEDVLQAWQRHPAHDDKLEPLINFLNEEVRNHMERSLARMDFTGTSSSKQEKKVKDNQKSQQPAVPTATGFMAAKPEDNMNKDSRGCAFCDKTNHNSARCRTAQKMPFTELQQILRKKNLCFVCLKGGHQSRECTSKVACGKCGGRHYDLMCRIAPVMKEVQPNQMMMVPSYPHEYGQVVPMHGENSQGYYYPPPQPVAAHHVPDSRNMACAPQPEVKRPLSFSADWASRLTQAPAPQQRPPGPNTGFTNINGCSQIALYSLMVKILTPEGPVPARVFVDEGSDESYIVTSVAEQTNCQQVGTKVMRHQLFGGGVTEPQVTPRFSVMIMDMNGSVHKSFIFNGKDRIAHRIPKPKLEITGGGLALHDQTDSTQDVQLLFGMDVTAQILTGGFQRINEFIICRETIYGWVMGGIQQNVDPDENTYTNMVTTMMIGNMSEEELWSLEIIGITDDAKTQTRQDMEIAAMDFFEETVKRESDGRYQVRLPWVDGHRKLESNRHQTIARLQAVTKDLKRDGYLDAYQKVLMEWLADGIIETVHDDNSGGYFLPHRHVLKEGSTTPVRPVFDASAKPKGSPSLNECLEKGPNMLELIPAVMTRFRRKRVGVVADIKKAFLQMSVSPEDRKVLQFLWWKDETCTEVQVYRHCRVVFGVKPSPFLLAATLQHHIRHEGHVDPVIAEKLLHSFYVDNSLSSHDTIEEASDFKEKSQQILLPAKMDLRGWEISSLMEEKTIQVLGMQWNTRGDYLSLSLESTLTKLNGPMTKRGLLSTVNSVFDPMGFVAPVTVVPKLLFQDCCKKGLKWDEPLPKEIAEPFTKWKSQVPALSKVAIPRWMCDIQDESEVELHIFCDASAFLFATSVFIRTIGSDGKVNVQLVMCRTRVAPYKSKITIPRLELLACLLGVRLAAEVKKYLQDDSIPCFYWTDSSTALAWIQHDKNWGRFVQARVDEIRRLSRMEDWRHIPGEYNPADLPSRGCSVEKLLQLQWWEGPAWIKGNPDEWPKSQITHNEEEVQHEMKKTVVSSMAQVKADALDDIRKFSEYYKSLRVIAIMLRYKDCLLERARERKAGAVSKLQLKKKRILPIQVRESTAEEIERAEKCIVKYIQRTGFNGISDDKLKKMNIVVDNEGIIRTKTQLLYGNDDLHTRVPVVLPSDHEVVKALIAAEHETNCHSGIQTTMALLRKRFWIMNSRRVVSGIISACPTCRRHTAQRCQVPAAPLPKDRVKDTVAFGVTGVDLLGPLFLRNGDRIWIVLYTCAVYRCVHLEITSTLSTEGFIRTFRRFVARRGRPEKVYSDNGLNFVGCNNLFSQLNWEEVRRYAAVQRIEWVFNPPTAAWWGGWWERLVGLTKKLIRRVLGKSVVDMEEFSTILCDVEATLNQRPLTYMSDRNGDLIPLCPAFFMRDNLLSNLPEADVVDSNVLRKTARRIQKLREEVRRRFRKDYLGELRHYAVGRELTVKPMDVVMIEDDNKKRMDWPWGVVQRVYAGRDGKIRTALVRTRTGEFLRPVQRLFILEAHIEEEKVFENHVEESEKVDDYPPDENECTGAAEQVQCSRYGRKIVKPDRLMYKN